MEIWLLPVSIFTKSIVGKGPLISQSFPFYFFVIISLYVFLTNKDEVENFKIEFKPFVFVSATILLQMISIYATNIRVGKEIYQTAGLLNGSISVILTVFIGVVIYYCTSQLLVDENKINNFFKSLIMTFVIYLLIILLPQVFGTFSNHIDSYLNLIGRTFEQQHVGRNDFYFAGSYATTLRRVNGLMPEASFMAAMLSIVFIPPILSAIINRYNFFNLKKGTSFLNWTLLILSVIVLFFAKTSTGFLAIGLAAFSLIIFSPKKDRQLYIFIGFAAIILIMALYLKVPYFRDLLNGYLFKKKGTSNRLGGTIALFSTFLHHPFIGVGMGFTSPYLFKYVPFDTTVNSEFIHVFENHGYADQSVWGEWFAYFGLFIMVPVIVFIVKKIKNSIKIFKMSDKSVLECFVIISFWIYLLDVLVVSIFSYEWNNCIYYLMFFVYVVVINFFRKNYRDNMVNK